MNKVLYDENGKAYSIDSFDKLVHGGFIKETDFVEELRKGVDDKELVPLNLFSNMSYDLSHNNTIVFSRALDGYNIKEKAFLESVRNGASIPSEEVADIIINNSTPLKRRVDIAIAMEIANNLSSDNDKFNDWYVYQSKDGLYKVDKFKGLVSSIPTTEIIAELIAEKLNKGYR